MARLSVSLLGGFQARLDSGPAIALPTRKAQALLAYLALPPGRAHPRDKLAALLWGGIRETSARASLRQGLFSIRKALGETDALRLEANTVALDPAAVEVDVDVFTRSVANGDPDAVARAADLYRGDLLAGLVVDEAPFEEWLLGERERLRELALEALAKLLAHHRRSGAPEQALATALKLLTLDPLQEPVHRVLIRLYSDLGRRGAGLRQYQQCVSALQRELGTEPEAETKRLYEEILRARPTRPLAEVADMARAATVGGAVRAVLPSARRSSAFVSRTAEIARLTDALAGAVAGHGAVVAVLGEAGVGKSRLLAEVAAEAAARHVVVLTGRAHESEQILPFGPWVDALRAAAVATDAPLLEALGPGSRSELARLLPEIGEVPRDTGDARRMFEAILALLGHLSAPAGVLLVLEDLHWADEMSARLLAFVGRRLDTHRGLVIVSVRAEELDEAAALGRALDELDREGCLTRLPLPPLSREDSDTLVRALARSGSDEEHLRRLAAHAWAVSDGNAFVIVEAVQAAAEGATVTDPSARALPERVREVVSRRLARLSGPARALASVAAVIGREFDFALLRHAAGLDEHVTAGAVEELVRRGILHGVGERFDFTHDRIRETAYAELLPPRRRLLHRRIAEALEELYAPNLATHLLALGRHYGEGEVWTKATSYLRDAGAAALARSANREAVACYEQALAALERLATTATTTEQAIALRFEIRNALFALGEHDRILEHLREAERLASRLGDPRQVGWVSVYMSQYFWREGDPQRAVDLARQALEAGRTSDDLALKVTAAMRLGQAYHRRGEFVPAIEAVEEAIRPLDGERSQARFGVAALPAVISRGFLVWSLVELGRFDEASAPAREALRLAEAANQAYSVSWALYCFALLHLRKGDIGQAVPLLERGVALDRATEVPVMTAYQLAALGYAYALGGREKEGIPLLEQSVEPAVFGKSGQHLFPFLFLTHAYVLARRKGEATQIGARTLELCEARGERAHRAWAVYLHGKIAEAEPHSAPARAEEQYRSAMSLAVAYGMRPLAAHCHAGLATTYGRARRDDEARVERDRARELFHALGMPFWDDRLEQEWAAIRP